MVGRKIIDIHTIADVLTQAKADGLIIEAVEPYSMAVTIAAILEGSLSAARVPQSLHKLHHCGSGLTQLLQLIRSRPGSQ